MKQIEKRTLLLGAAAICWGILFPEYLFTTDSYTAFVQETEDAGASGAGQADGIEHEEASADAEDLYEAVRSGRVRYRFRIYEYLKHHFFSRIEKEENALLWRELCALRGDAGSERGIVYLWSTQGRTDMRRSAYLIRESAG